jgi:hypothetical protein
MVKMVRPQVTAKNNKFRIFGILAGMLGKSLKHSNISDYFLRSSQIRKKKAL